MEFVAPNARGDEVEDSGVHERKPDGAVGELVIDPRPEPCGGRRIGERPQRGTAHLVVDARVRVNASTTGAQADDASFNAAISEDGAWVGFPSVATNLVPGDTNGATDGFVRGPFG